MIIKYLIEKEFKQMLRNSFIPRLVIVFPCMTMILMPWAANLEIRNINLDVIDNDHSVTSRRLLDKVEASTYFYTYSVSQNYNDALKNVEKGSSDVILEIPRDFEKELVNGNSPMLQISANAVNGTKGSMGGSYLSQIVSDYSKEMQKEKRIMPLTNSSSSSMSAQSVPKINIKNLNLFNPTLDYKYFMVPALMVLLLTLICGFLPALNIVGEKEAGTIEQINVTPVNKFSFIVAKLIPYWVVGIVILTLCFILAWLLYGIIPSGHFITIYIFAFIYILLISGLGLLISNNSATLQQALFVMWFSLIVCILMSGLFTPIHSMPRWAQLITYLNPMRYFVEIMRTIYLRGGGFAELTSQLIALVSFATVLNLFAVRSYRKSS